MIAKQLPKTLPTRIAKGTFTDEEKRIAKILDRLVERGLFQYAKRAAEEHHVLINEMLSTDRSKSCAHARHRMWQLMHDEANLSWPQVARLFDKKHDRIMRSSTKRESKARRLVEERIVNKIALFIRDQGRGDLAELLVKGAWKDPLRGIEG